MIQISNFGEDEIVSGFYACALHVLCIVRILIIHPHSGKHDVGGGNHCCVRWNVHLMERVLCGNKINFYSSNNIFLCNIGAKNFLRTLTVIICIQSAITCHDSNFKFWRRRGRLHVERFLHGNKINFDSFNH